MDYDNLTSREENGPCRYGQCDVTGEALKGRRLRIEAQALSGGEGASGLRTGNAGKLKSDWTAFYFNGGSGQCIVAAMAAGNERVTALGSERGIAVLPLRTIR